MEQTTEQPETQKPEMGSSSETAYRIEIRASHQPLVLPSGEVIATEWMRFPNVEIQGQIPGIGRDGRPAMGAGTASRRIHDVLTDTYSFHAAMALACSWYAQSPELEWRTELRLVEYQREVKYSLTRAKDIPFATGMDMAVMRRDQSRA